MPPTTSSLAWVLTLKSLERERALRFSVIQRTQLVRLVLSHSLLIKKNALQDHLSPI